MRAKHCQLILSLLAFLLLAACDFIPYATQPTYTLSVNLITDPELTSVTVTLFEAETGEPAEVFKKSAIQTVFIVDPGVAYDYQLEFEGELTDFSVSPWNGACHPGEPYVQTYDDANYMSQEEICNIRIGVPEAAAEVAGVVSAVVTDFVKGDETGVRIILATDINHNGQYDEGVDVIISEAFIPYPEDGEDGADGEDGQDGADGTDGEDGTDGLTTLVDVTEIGESEACPFGGVRIDVGPDKNRNDKLDEDEISDTTYICNGAPGANGQDGEDGLNALVNVIPVEPGENCPTGGVRIDVGLDLNRDGALDDSEITKSVYVCNGAPGADGGDGANGQDGVNALVDVTTVEPGNNCPAGGVRIDVGLDDDGDGILDESEITKTSYVCNGATPEVPTCDAQLVDISDAQIDVGGYYAVSWNWTGFSKAYLSGHGFTEPREPLASETGTHPEIRADHTGGYTYVLTAVDENGLECTSSAYIEVVNTPPQAEDDVYEVAYYAVTEDELDFIDIMMGGSIPLRVEVPGQRLVNIYQHGVLNNDSDPNGDTLFAELVAPPAFGEVSLDRDGSFVFTYNRQMKDTQGCSSGEGSPFFIPPDCLVPPPAPQVSFTYEVSDAVATDTATVTLCFVDVEGSPCFNAPPEPVNDYYVFDPIEGSLTIPVADLLSNDNDGNTGDGVEEPLSIFLLCDYCASYGTVEYDKEAGTVTYTPDFPSDFGQDEFYYVISDGTRVSISDATVKILSAGDLIARDDYTYFLITDGIETPEGIQFKCSDCYGENVLDNDEGGAGHGSRLTVDWMVPNSLSVFGYGDMGETDITTEVDINLVLNEDGTYSVTIPAGTLDSYESIEITFDYTMTDGASTDTAMVLIFISQQVPS